MYLAVLLLSSVFVQQIHTLKCIDERKVSLKSTFVDKLKVSKSQQYKSCTVIVKYDPAPEEVVYVTHHGETTTKTGCEYKDSVQRWDDDIRDFEQDEMYTITCHCTKNKCNIPEIVMNYLDKNTDTNKTVLKMKQKILKSMIDKMDEIRPPKDETISLRSVIIICLVIPMMIILLVQTGWTVFNAYKSYQELLYPETAQKIKVN